MKKYRINLKNLGTNGKNSLLKREVKEVLFLFSIISWTNPKLTEVCLKQKRQEFFSVVKGLMYAVAILFSELYNLEA